MTVKLIARTSVLTFVALLVAGLPPAAKGQISNQGCPTGTSGGGNSCFGFQAGRVNGSASNNSYFGNQAGYSNAAFGNSFFGSGAGYSNTAFGNSFFGYLAGTRNTTGTGNSFFGFQAGPNSTGGNNSFFGSNAGYSNVGGNGNAFFGYYAGYFNSAGNGNSFFGFQAGRASTGGSNSFFGYNAGSSNVTGANNSFFGYQAGSSNTTGSNNIYIANSGAGTESGVIRIGGTTQTQTFVGGVAGVNVAGGVPVLVSPAGQLGIQTSSRRFKEDIREMGDASSRLMRLRPVAFFYRQADETGARARQYGLVAEEVAEVYPELVQYSAEGTPGTVRYHLLTPMLLNELQKQHRKVDTQQQQLSVQAQRIADLETRLQRLEAGMTRRAR